MKRFAWTSLLAVALAGCTSSGEVTHDGATIQDQEVRVKEPRSGWPDAPPLGSPRAKLPPDDIIVRERDEKNAEEVDAREEED